MLVMIVEDEALVALDLADEFEVAGHGVAGPFRRVRDAMAALDKATPDAAVLDVNLVDGETSAPIAEALERMDAPFLFITGYTAARAEVLNRFPDAQQLSKPANPKDVVRAIEKLAVRA